jgi:hypothetical protein
MKSAIKSPSSSYFTVDIVGMYTGVDLQLAEWDKVGDHPALGEVSVKRVVRIISVHERIHLKEIRYLL